MNFRDYLSKNVAPPWLQQPNGLAWNRAVGDVMDSLEDRIRRAVKARFPRHSPADALARIGDERGLERGATESAASFAERVVHAWETWTWGGTPYGMLRALWHLGYKTPKLVIVRGKCHSLDANGELVIEDLPTGSWAIDSTPWFWSKFQLLFPLPHPWAAPAGVTFQGTGDMVLTPGGTPNGPHLIEIACRTGGSFKTAEVDISFDGILSNTEFVPENGELALDTLQGAPATGIVVRFSGMGMVAGDEWSFTSGTFPASASETVEQLRRIVRKWKPSHATCAGIVVVTSDRIVGWPRTALDGFGTLGGAARTIWTV